MIFGIILVIVAFATFILTVTLINVTTDSRTGKDRFDIVLGLSLTAMLLIFGIYNIIDEHENKSKEQQCISQGYEWDNVSGRCFEELKEIPL